MPCFGDVFPSCRNTLRLVPARSIFTSLYATLLRIASLLLIFFALHRHAIYSARCHPAPSCPLRPRAAIICAALALYLPHFSLSLSLFNPVYFAPLRFSVFPAIYFTFLRSNFMLLHSAPLCIARYRSYTPFFGFLALFRFASLSFVLMCPIFHIPFGPVSPDGFLRLSSIASRLRIFLARFVALRAILPPSCSASLCPPREPVALEKSKPD